MRNLLKSFSSLFRGKTSKNIKIFIAVFVLILLFLGLMRACTPREEAPVYRIANNAAWLPSEIADKQKRFLGFINELLLLIARREELRVELANTNDESLLVGLERGDYDAAIFNSLETYAGVGVLYDLSEPIYSTGPVLIVRVNTDVHSLNELDGKLIGIRKGASVIFDIKAYPSILFSSYENMIDALSDLQKNKIDGVILDSIASYGYIKGIYAGKLKVATGPLTTEAVRLILLRSPDSQEWIKKFNAGLNSTKADGTYAALLDKWGLFNTVEMQ